jgi:N-acetylneuraminic acid mutarotase
VNPTATLLGDGRVIVAAGGGGGAAFTSELYDPNSGTWSLSGSLNSSHDWGQATPLADGRVLLVAGLGSGAAEIFDPGSGTWTPTGSMNIDRGFHTATLLMDGRVLVTGGATQQYAVGNAWSAEIFDPTTGTWTFTAPMLVWRFEHTATLLSDGTVLVAGGRTRYGPEPVTATAEIYNPIADTWTAAATMTSRRSDHTATALADGRVLVAGGFDFPGPQLVYFASAEIYNPVTGTWTGTGSMADPRADHTATRLGEGVVGVSGGQNDTPYGNVLLSAERWDSSTGMWTSDGTMNHRRSSHRAIFLINGSVLVVGGAGNDDPTSTELFMPTP